VSGTVSSSKTFFEFTIEEMQKRVVDHWEFADDFIDAYTTAYGIDQLESRIVVNRRRLAMATESAYQDIARYKIYHQRDPWNSKLDSVKRSAYLSKWICRFKPLVVISASGHDPDLNDEELDDVELVNEFFCIFLFETHLSQEIGYDVGLSDRKGAEFAYDLLYRVIGVDGWIAIFQLVKDCCHPKFSKSCSFIVKL
jgi:hypothetical protein